MMNLVVARKQRMCWPAEWLWSVQSYVLCSYLGFFKWLTHERAAVFGRYLFSLLNLQPVFPSDVVTFLPVSQYIGTKTLKQQHW